MLINVTDPYSHELIQLNARPELLGGEQGWRIRFPYKFGFFVFQQNGRWRVMDDINIHPDLLDAIGTVLHPLALANVFQLKPPQA